MIVVSRSWDDRDGPVAPKSRKGSRRVPIPQSLRIHLVAHKLRTGRDGDDLVFGIEAIRPFSPAWTRKRACTAWETENKKRRKAGRPELQPIGLHELRHSYVSMMFAAGLSLEQIGDYVGHGSTYMTDRYRHLLEGHEAEAAKRFDAYLAGATGAQTGAQTG